MRANFGEHFKLTIFGESHGPAIGVVLDGLPAGAQIDETYIARQMARRAPGNDPTATARKEADAVRVLSGVLGGRATGAPLCAMIENTNTRSGDYASMAARMRPGHADYTAEVKYGGYQDRAGGGHFSGRLTAPLCIAGGICLQLLAREGIAVVSRIASIAGICDEGELISSTADKEFPVVNDACGEKMRAAIAQAREEGDSVGGVIECAVFGAPAGLGDPMFGGMENRIAAAIFGIPAVKGVEFGAGFGAAKLRGSENNDAFSVEDRHRDEPLRRHSRRYHGRNAHRAARGVQADAVHRAHAAKRQFAERDARGTCHHRPSRSLHRAAGGAGGGGYAGLRSAGPAGIRRAAGRVSRADLQQKGRDGRGGSLRNPSGY